jgi:hypothetical protein
MKVKNLAALKNLMVAHGMDVDEDGQVSHLPVSAAPAQSTEVRTVPDTALLETMRRIELILSERPAEKVGKQPVEWEFDVERGEDGFTVKIIAKATRFAS